MNEQEDVLSESSPESNEQQTAETSQPEQSDPSPAKEQAKTEDNVPFHLHPRFQEVISEKNAIKEQNAAFQRELAELKKQVQASTPAEKDELMDRLESIDPKFAALLKGMRDEQKALKQTIQDLSGWREQSSAQTTAQQVQGMKNQFYTENKIPEDRKGIYEAMVQAEASRNPNLQVSDLPKVMKQVHDSLGKMFQTAERATTKQFVDSKKAEASKPTSLPKGAPAKATKPDNTSVSASDLRAQMVKEALDSVRSAKDI
jgi:hypothetical protein